MRRLVLLVACSCVKGNPDDNSRDGYDVWSMVVEQLRQRSPDLLLFSGDAVTIGITQFEWEEFFDRAEPLFARVPLISTNGNHENNAVNYYSQIALPGRVQQAEVTRAAC